MINSLAELQSELANYKHKLEQLYREESTIETSISKAQTKIKKIKLETTSSH